MKKLLIPLFLLCFGAAFGQAPTNGYPPKIFTYGNWFNRLRADSALHVPHKYSMTQNTTDSTPQVFVYSTPAGDSLVFFVRGIYHIVGTGSGSGTDSAVVNGLWMRRSASGTVITIFADSATMAGYLLRRADSVYAYVTPTALATGLAGKIGTSLSPGMVLIGNGSGVASPFTVTGDGGFSSSGVFTLTSILAASSCTNCNLVYDAKGRITSASSGVGGGGVTLAQLAKNMPSNDTTWRRMAMIPDIDVGFGTCNGCNLHWFPLITGGNHGQTPNMDSDLYVFPNGHLAIYFETMQAVANANMQNDEIMYPISWSVIGNADNIELIGNLLRSGLGFMLHGNNTNAWIVANSQQLTYVINGNSGSGPDSVTAAGATWIKFDLADLDTAYLGPTISGLVATYHGSNGYSIERYSGAPHQFNFQLRDAFGGIVIGYPQTSDSIWVYDGAAHWEQLDLRQFLTGTNWLFAHGLSNGWFGADVRMFPDSQRIGHPFLTAIASGTAGQINLTWPRVTNDLNGYLLERSTTFNFSGGVTTLVNPISLGGTLVTSFNDTGLTTGTTYYYRIRASRINGQYSDHSRRQTAIAP